MSTRLLSLLSVGAHFSTVKHYLGFPPEIVGGVDFRQPMRSAAFLLIEENPDGVFLYRYDCSGGCVGDTWHESIEDAKHQADFEYNQILNEWQDVPADVEDGVSFGLVQLKTASERGN